MTDRIHSLSVVLDHDMRIDDVDTLISALRCFRHVIDVVPATADPDSIMAEVRVQNKLRTKVIAMLKEL